MSYFEKYLKYKNKYISLKKQLGGSDVVDINNINITEQIKRTLLAPEMIACRNLEESVEDYTRRINSMVVVPDTSGPLKFADKLETANYFAEEGNKIDLCRFIECYARNPTDPVDEVCELFSNVYNESSDSYDSKPIEAISVNQNGDRYTIMDGRHRFVANIIKNKKTLLVNILNKKDSSEPSAKKRN
jgi:hypothetical protein